MKNKLSTNLKENLSYLIAKPSGFMECTPNYLKHFILINNWDFFQHKVEEHIMESLKFEEKIMKSLTPKRKTD